MLKKKLTNLVLDKPVVVTPPPPNYDELQLIRQKIKSLQKLSLHQFCHTKPDFNPKHGLVYKLLKTSKQRLQDSTLCTHDMRFWLNQNNVLNALWIIKLAGKDVGLVGRNQLLHHLKTVKDVSKMQKVYQITKKWGFPNTKVTENIMANPKTVEEARLIYKNLKSTKKEKQAMSNKLLKEIIQNADRDVGMQSEKWAEDVFRLFKTFNKDLITFQIMLGGMIMHKGLRKFHSEVWESALNQERANNLTIDDKLRETNERVIKLHRSAHK